MLLQSKQHRLGRVVVDEAHYVSQVRRCAAAASALHVFKSKKQLQQQHSLDPMMVDETHCVSLVRRCAAAASSFCGLLALLQIKQQLPRLDTTVVEEARCVGLLRRNQLFACVTTRQDLQQHQLCCTCIPQHS